MGDSVVEGIQNIEIGDKKAWSISISTFRRKYCNEDFVCSVYKNISCCSVEEFCFGL